MESLDDHELKANHMR